ncbi:MAG: peptidase M50 [Planctomycetaceae bacterium]|nr:peptidase M50 [Planctomycetaceae bacterium]
MQLQNGSLRLFRLFGIDVFLHWSWLIIAYFRIRNPIVQYESQAWAVAEYLSLFGIVLLHEFGHALACRSVGGTAQRIVLWPLGGVAYVAPPPRPGAVLWSLAAGPLVNVVLLPVTLGIVILSMLLGGLQPEGQIDGAAAPPAVEKAAEAPGVGNVAPEAEKLDATRPSDIHQFLTVVAVINLVLLVFNMLPIYPLDGGQIVQALLWFVIGRARSLMLVTGVSLVAGVGLIGLAVIIGDWWLVVLAVFVAITAWNGLQQSRVLVRML